VRWVDDGLVAEVRYLERVADWVAEARVGAVGCRGGRAWGQRFA